MAATKRRGRIASGTTKKKSAASGNGSAAVVGFEQKLWQAADKFSSKASEMYSSSAGASP